MMLFLFGLLLFFVVAFWMLLGMACILDLCVRAVENDNLHFMWKAVLVVVFAVLIGCWGFIWLYVYIIGYGEMRIVL